MSKRGWKKYSAELKLSAVEAYLTGAGSLREIRRRYNVSGYHTLQDWIVWYNGHKEFKQPSAARGTLYMTKGKETTQQERA